MLTWYVDRFVTLQENTISCYLQKYLDSPHAMMVDISTPWSKPCALIVYVRRSTLALVVRRQLSDWDALDLPQLAYALVGLQLWYVPYFHNHWYISSICSRPRVRVCMSIV